MRILARMAVVYRLQELHRVVAMTWLLHWRRRYQHGIRKSATVVSLRALLL